MPDIEKIRIHGVVKDIRDPSKVPLPSTAGTNWQILRSDGSGGTVWTDPATEEEIGASVESWMDENITSDGTIVVDSTLSISGAAADAKVTGDELTSLKSAFDLVTNNLLSTETQTDKQNNYYCLIDTLTYGKTYRIGVSVATAGNYGVKVCTDGSASYVVSTLIPDNTPFNANEKKYVLYTPVGNGEKYIRLSSNTVSWSVYVSEVIDVSDVSAQVDENKDNIETLDGDVSYVAETIDTFTKTETDKQLFDYHNAEIYRGIFDGSNNTFTNTVARNAMVMVAEVNVASEKTFSMNLISEDAYSDFGIEKINLIATNQLPVANNTYLSAGSANAQEKRAAVTTSQSTKYILLSILVLSDAYSDNFDFAPILSKIVVREGNYDETYYNYRILDVQEDNLSTEIQNKLNQAGDVNAYRQILTQTLHVGASVLTDQSVSLGTGWSGTISDGFAHVSGSADPLSFNVATENNSSYLVSFTLSNIAEKSVSVKIGDSALVDVYNGTTSINVGIVADGGYLSIVPASAWAGTITNLKLRKVGETGDEIVFEVKNVDTKVNNPSLTGFWNVILGVDNFGKNQNGSRNISVGYASLSKLESGTRNICIGTFSMPFVKDGDRNIAIGADSLYSTRNHTHAHAEDCIAIGYRAMSDGTNIKYNVAIGTNAMKESTNEATYNVCVGAGAGMFANYGLTAIGYNACAKSYTKADGSVFVGRNSGVDNTGATAQNPKNVYNVIAIGDSVLAKNTNDACFGNANNVIYLAGKRIVFNNDHTVTWEEDT